MHRIYKIAIVLAILAASFGPEIRAQSQTWSQDPSLGTSATAPSNPSSDGHWSYQCDSLTLADLSRLPVPSLWNDGPPMENLSALANPAETLTSWSNDIDSTAGVGSSYVFTKVGTSMKVGRDRMQSQAGCSPRIVFRNLGTTGKYHIKAKIRKLGDATNETSFGDGMLFEVYKIARASGVVTRLWSTLLARPDPSNPASVNLLVDLAANDEVIFRASSPTNNVVGDKIYFASEPVVKIANILTISVPPSTSPADDKTHAIQVALWQANSYIHDQGYDRAEVVLGSGDYYLNADASLTDNRHLFIYGLDKVTLRGSPVGETRLISNNFRSQYLAISNSANVCVEDLCFDTREGNLPFIQGTYNGTAPLGNSLSFDLDWQPANQGDFSESSSSNPTKGLELVFFSDSDSLRPVISTPGAFTTAFEGGKLSITLQAAANWPAGFKKGYRVIVKKWLASGADHPDVAGSAISIEGGSTDTEFRNVTIRSAMALAIMCNGNGLHLDRYRVEKNLSIPSGKQRLMSTVKDGVHFQGGRRGPTIENSVFGYLADDAVNLHASVFGAITANGFTPASGDSLFAYSIGNSSPGIFVKSNGAQGVMAGYSYPTDSNRFVNMSSSAEGYIIRNCLFDHVRMRALLLNTGFGLISGNFFKESTWYAIQYDGNNSEGPFCRDILTRANYFYQNGWYGGQGNYFAIRVGSDVSDRISANPDNRPLPAPFYQNTYSQIDGNIFDKQSADPALLMWIGQGIPGSLPLTNVFTQVELPLWFSTQPLSQAVFVGANVVFNAALREETPRTMYQWAKNGVVIAGAESHTLTLSNVQLPGAGSYGLQASNEEGAGVSRFGRLVVLRPQPNAATYSEIARPTTVTSAGKIDLDYWITNVGTKNWNTNHYLSVQDSSGNFVAWDQLVGVTSGESKRSHVSFTAPNSVGDFSYTVRVIDTGVEFLDASSPFPMTVLSRQPNSVSYNRTTFPYSAAPGSNLIFNYSVTNTGTKVWGSSHLLSLRNGAGVYSAFSSLNGVVPDQSKTVNMSLSVPTTPGTYSYLVQAMEDGVEFFNGQSNLTLVVRAPQPNAAVYNSVRSVDNTTVGKTVNLRYSITNAGTATWSDRHYMSLRDGNGGYLSFVPVSGVAPGASTTVDFTIVAPSTPGIYTYYVQGLEDGVEFFDTQDNITLTVLATPIGNAASYNATTFPITAGRGANVSFSSTITNWGTKTWGANHYLTLRDADNAFLAFAPVNGILPGAGTTVNFNFVAPTSPGIYSYRIQGLESGIEFFNMTNTLVLFVP